MLQVIDEAATQKRQEEADKAVKEGEEKPKVRLSTQAPVCRCDSGLVLADEQLAAAVGRLAGDLGVHGMSCSSALQRQRPVLTCCCINVLSG